MTAMALAEATLTELEAIIDRGKQTFVEVGNALTEIRERKLYRERYATFEDYCQQRHGFSSSRGRQLIAAAATVTAVTLSGGTPPATEREARALAAERRQDRWLAPGGGAERQAAEIAAYSAARNTPAAQREAQRQKQAEIDAAPTAAHRKILTGNQNLTPEERAEFAAYNLAQHRAAYLRDHCDLCGRGGWWLEAWGPRPTKEPA